MSHVLIVEDDADIAALIAHYLEDAAHSARNQPDGSDALRRIKASPPDLAVLDIMLPGIERARGLLRSGPSATRTGCRSSRR